MLKARSGTFCLKFQIILMHNNWTDICQPWGEDELPVLLRFLAVLADASTSQTCRRHLSFTRQSSGTSHLWHQPAAIVGETRLHWSWRLAAKQSRSEPVNYKIWGIVHQRVYKCHVSNVDKLKQRLVELWDDLQQTVIDSAVSQCRQPPRACMRAEGHFEQWACLTDTWIERTFV